MDTNRFGLKGKKQGLFSAEVLNALLERRAVEITRGLAVLTAVHAVVREHGASLGGCGCCGSPFLELPELENVSFERVNFGEDHVGFDLRVTDSVVNRTATWRVKMDAKGQLVDDD